MHHFGHSFAASFNQNRDGMTAAKVKSSNWLKEISGCFNTVALILLEL
jgi:hypothetical protein